MKEMKPKMVKAFQQGDSVVMVIPAELAEILKIAPGDFLNVHVEHERLVAEKVFRLSKSEQVS